VTHRKHTFDPIPLNHPLEPYLPFIDGLMRQLTAHCPASHAEAEPFLLDAIQLTTGATGVRILRRRTHAPNPSTDPSERFIHPDQAEALSPPLFVETDPFAEEADRFVDLDLEHLEGLDGIEQMVEIQSLLRQVLASLLERPALRKDYHGLVQAYATDEATRLLVLIPLELEHLSQMMVIWGVPTGSLLTGEVCSQILVALYEAIQTRSPLRPHLIEAAMLDQLRRSYGFLPIALYNRRFDLFCDRLSQMVVYFEPVLRLDPDYLYIDSWEALAGDPENDQAPVDLFEAAELWGDRFLIELDAYFLEQAVKSYRDACQFSSGRRRKEDIRELSVNVYPQSLVRSAYYEAVERIVRDKLVQPEKLILEISEKFPLPLPHTETSDAAMAVFRQRLSHYVRDLKIGFAIDDFGVGHASVSRLAGLNPSHVKVDRNILHQDRTLSEITLRFVIDLASSQRLRAPKIVVEGFDRGSPISLQRLYRLGIRYVQGHIIGKADPELSRLGKDQYEYLKGLIRD
jgi:EAL domain-containing protein (putative c-di-GMP-specific phosphodiesterase class I)